MPTPARVVVVIPTYNEAENIAVAAHEVLSALPEAHLLVVDDGSPDGTGALADALAEHDPRVHVLHREEKAGLGAAYLAGFRWALDRDYEVIGEFDADGSHPARALPTMLQTLGRTSRPRLVIGSRWVEGGSVVDWPRSREWLSRGGNAYARLMLRMPVADATGGFRLYNVSALRAIALDEVASRGYCFQVDLALRVLDAGGTVAETPIEFRERLRGSSKMSRAIVLEAMLSVTIWGVRRAAGRLQALSRGHARVSPRPAGS